MPSRSRHASSRSGSGPVSTRTTPASPRTSTASPCPMSHIATRQSEGTAPERSSGVATLDTPPTTSAPASTVAATCRARASRRERVTSSRASTVRTVSASIPPSPGSQAIRGDGQVATARAIEAIHQAGTAARRIATSAPPGHHGARRQPISPSPVATGAAGSASRFASTP